MIGDRRVLGVILARGGSKGLPRKNVLELGGKPVVSWSVEACRGSRFLDRFILSTDDDEIAAAAHKAGCEVPFMRPPELATDDASVHGALMHALDNVDEEYDLLVALQATSPFRTGADIDGALEILVERDGKACVSVTESGKPPFWHMAINAEGRLDPVIAEPENLLKRRQDLPATYELNGAVFAVHIAWYSEHQTFYSPDTLAFVMPKARSVDIDAPIDLALARAMADELSKP